MLQQDGARVMPEVVSRMTELLAHRGPDGTGHWSQGPIALGHRRLSIVDLSERGANPMAANDPRIRITYNGELYNMPVLRRDLEPKGYRFHSRTDTEVVVNMYQEYGLDALPRFNGMFAFAIWDGRANRLILARDRFGVKPLFWCELGRSMLFASEIKAFLADPRFTPEPDFAGLSQQLSFMGMLGAQTMFRGVRLLEPGHLIVADLNGVAQRSYAHLRPDPQADVGEDEWVERIDAAFSASVKAQMQSDVPLCSYLSGGLDTSAITATALGYQSPMHTFTCGFQLPEDASELERHFDETAASRETAEYLATHHHELLLNEQDMPRVLDRLAWHLEEPRAGICYQNYLTARMIGVDHGLKVVLSGLGGDELYAGYHWRIGAAAVLPAEGFVDAYYPQACRLLSDTRKSQLLKPDVLAALAGYTPRDDFGTILEGTAHLPPGERALYFEFYTFLQSLLLLEDKLSMAHSLEARVPFLDNDLVDIALCIPLAQKIQAGRGKAILRKALARRLPPHILDRRKQGFTPPDKTWYRTVHRDFLFDTLLANDGALAGLMRKDKLEEILVEHMRGAADHRFLIWSLLVLQSSFHQFTAQAMSARGAARAGA